MSQHFRAADADGYDQKVAIAVPGYSVIHQSAAALLHTLLPDGARILIIGAGTGADAFALHQQNPDWHLTCVEPLIEMLDRAREKTAAIMQERLHALQFEADPAIAGQALSQILSKMDVQEELDRLRFHIEEARKTLQQDGAIGRRLDFLMQEFNREANTLGSKAGDNAQSQASVELKVLIEQMREQVQNLV